MYLTHRLRWWKWINVNCTSVASFDLLTIRSSYLTSLLIENRKQLQLLYCSAQFQVFLFEKVLKPNEDGFINEYNWNHSFKQDLLQWLLVASLFEFEKLMQQPMYFTIVIGRTNKAIFYPLWELVDWVGKGPFWGITCIPCVNQQNCCIVINVTDCST